VEVPKKTRIEVPKVQNAIDQRYATPKRYRNAVSHIQTKYRTEKWNELVLDDAPSEKISKVPKQVHKTLVERTLFTKSWEWVYES
jgi:hypothetical protein